MNGMILNVKIRICVLLALLLFFSAETITAQKIGVKTNVLYDATSTLNVGVETAISEQWTLDASFNYNGWLSTDTRSMKHWIVQPELRYWLYQNYNGHFFGLHGHYAGFNMGGYKMPFGMFKGLRNNRYRGNISGVGISYGYQWILGNYWGLELTAGIGYARINYERFKCWYCADKEGSYHKNYFGPTKVGVSLIYLIK